MSNRSYRAFKVLAVLEHSTDQLIVTRGAPGWRVLVVSAYMTAFGTRPARLRADLEQLRSAGLLKSFQWHGSFALVNLKEVSSV